MNTSENLTPNEKDDRMVACSSEVLNCGSCRTRTYDLFYVKEMLFQLS